MRTVEIRDIGPIAEASFVLQVGMNVLRGPNGAGKTRALEAVSRLTSGRGSVAPRDGATRGEAEGFGAVMRVGRKVTQRGEIDVVSLEGRFDLSHLVDPGLKDDAAADAQRIKALVQLAGGSGADQALFYPLLGEQQTFEQYVSPSATETDDVVTMAARIKRDLENHARQQEHLATRELAAAEAARALAKDVDLSGSDNTAELQADLEFAITENQRLQSEAKAITQKLQDAQVARRSLGGVTRGISIEQAMTAEAQAASALALADGEVLELEAQLETARNNAKLAKLHYENTQSTLQQALEHQQTVDDLRAAIDAAADVEPIAQELLEQAAADVQQAREALERGAVIREAKGKLTAADEHAKQAAKHRHTADWLRDAGKATDEVLSDLVGRLGCPLRVSGGRLVTDTVRGETFYSELSHGERTKIAMSIATEAVGPNGLIVAPQEFWEGLDPENRQMVHQQMVEAGVYGLTAEAALGDLRAEVA